jgi:hypothetical protein
VVGDQDVDTSRTGDQLTRRVRGLQVGGQRLGAFAAQPIDDLAQRVLAASAQQQVCAVPVQLACDRLPEAAGRPGQQHPAPLDAHREDSM